MRYVGRLLGIALILAACKSGDDRPDAAVLNDAPIDSEAGDAAELRCLPADGCAEGPKCGSICCGKGEACVADLCKCGNGARCTGDDRCESAGPLPASGCGNVCCDPRAPIGCPQ